MQIGICLRFYFQDFKFVIDKCKWVWYNTDVVERLGNLNCNFHCEPPENIVLSMTIKGSNKKYKRVATE